MDKVQCTVVQSVIDKIAERSRQGTAKYGTTLADNELPLDAWLDHLQEELMDAINYIQRAKQELKSKESFTNNPYLLVTGDMI